jgi:hypothetical protein
MKYLLLSASSILFSLNAGASSFTFDFTTGPSNPGSGLGNVRTFTSASGDLTVTVTAWGVTGNNNTTFQAGQLGQWSGLGLGDCDAREHVNCGSPDHQVDNAEAYDFVLFQFDTPVVADTVTIQPYGTWDRDVTYYTGNTANSLDLTGKTLAQLNGIGLTDRQNDDSTTSSLARMVTLSSIQGNALLFGARVGGDNSTDYFKISGLTVEIPDGATQQATPEPAALGLIGGALVGIGFIRRYRL